METVGFSLAIVFFIALLIVTVGWRVSIGTRQRKEEDREKEIIKVLIGGEHEETAGKPTLPPKTLEECLTFSFNHSGLYREIILYLYTSVDPRRQDLISKAVEAITGIPLHEREHVLRKVLMNLMGSDLIKLSTGVGDAAEYSLTSNGRLLADRLVNLRSH